LIEAKLATEAEYLYAKVIQQSNVNNVNEDLFLLHFTDVHTKAMAILNALCQPG
jgi:adenylate cyclase